MAPASLGQTQAAKEPKALACSVNIRYGIVTVEVGMRKRVVTLVSIIALGLLLGGCSKCGWIWKDWQAQSCHPAPSKS
jgi:hypothetical protein